MAADGHGQNAIAETLNREGVPTFGDGLRRPGRHWYRSYVARLLANPAVIGTFVPFTLDYEQGRRKRKPQTPVPDYYPPIVEVDLYEKVRALYLDKVSPRRGRHALSEVQNVLGGLAKCPICQGSMTRVNKGSREKAGKPYLVCAKAKAGAGCDYRSIKLEAVELCLRESAAMIVERVPATTEGRDLQERLRDIEVNIDAAEGAIARLLNVIEREPSPALRERLRNVEDDLEKLKGEEKSLWDRVAATNGPLIEVRLSNLRAALDTENFTPSTVNLALRQLLAAVVVNYKSGYLEFDWLHGGKSEYLFGWPQDD
jgi:hypothetical protein